MLSLREAQKVIEAGMKKAEEMGLKECLAVTDVHGNLIAFGRMDGAWAMAIDLATNKAYTSGTTGFPTSGLGQIAQPGQVAYGIALADKGRAIIFAGGVPLMKDGELLGGVGVSGALANQDEEVAKAAAEAL